MRTLFAERKKIKAFFSREEARKYYEDTKTAVVGLGVFFSLLGLINPALPWAGLGVLGDVLRRFHKEFFGDKEKRDFYKFLFSPKMARKHFITVGYEIPEDRFFEHRDMLEGLDVGNPEAIKKAQKKEKIVRTYQKWREIGLSKKQLVTHFWIIGTTGAGKTSFVMTALEKQMEIGGGVIFVDGKADEAMAYKLYSLAKKVGREHDFYLINFLNTEKFKEHTNTINPIANAPADQIIEFFKALKGEAQGDQAYWVGRGVALLSPIVKFSCLRRDYYGENFTFTVLYDHISSVDKFTFMSAVVKAMVSALEEKVRNTPGMEEIFQTARAAAGVVDENYPYVDALVYYYKNNPSKLPEIEMKGLDYTFMSTLWQTYNLILSYAGQISSEWVDGYINVLAEKFYENFGIDLLKVKRDILIKYYSELIKSNPNLKVPVNEMQDAFQQHAYAQQQWTDIFTTLASYDHIFSSLTPDVDMLDVLKNQKILYVLLPPLKQSSKTTNLLGKIILTMIRQAVATALGGPFENLSRMQKEILKDIITPKPLGLVVLDEYGAYPIEGLDVLLAQVRSINVSIILATQDYTSARVEGKDENSVRRAWGNTQKLVLRVKDDETLKMLKESMPEKAVLKSSVIEYDGYHHEKADRTVEKEPIIDPKILQGLKNGAGVIITDEFPVLIQTYWADAKPAEFVEPNKFVWGRMA